MKGVVEGGTTASRPCSSRSQGTAGTDQTAAEPDQKSEKLVCQRNRRSDLQVTGAKSKAVRAKQDKLNTTKLRGCNLNQTNRSDAASRHTLSDLEPDRCLGPNHERRQLQDHFVGASEWRWHQQRQR
jgi:hypothetical protein